MENQKMFDEFNGEQVRIARSAYNAAIAFGTGVLSNIRNELLDYGVQITDQQVFKLTEKFHSVN